MKRLPALAERDHFFGDGARGWPSPKSSSRACFNEAATRFASIRIAMLWTCGQLAVLLRSDA